VTCAIAIQQRMAEQATTAIGPQIRYRIGINIGDIIIDGDDIFGDGVNVAARLEGIAEPGGICISSSAYEQVQGKVKVDFSDLGEHSLKNISRPIRAYAVSQEVNPDRRASTSSSAPRLSIVVLPLTNIGADPEQEYFVDGLAEDLITDLSRIAGLPVIARNSTFIYKGRPISVAQVGRELGVRYVVEGSVRKIDNRVRITAQLIDVATSTHVWADRYDRDLTDIFAVQDEITREIVGALRLRLTPDGEPRSCRDRARFWTKTQGKFKVV